jgi:hypothetical protein
MPAAVVGAGAEDECGCDENEYCCEFLHGASSFMASTGSPGQADLTHSM